MRGAIVFDVVAFLALVLAVFVCCFWYGFALTL